MDLNFNLQALNKELAGLIEVIEVSMTTLWIVAGVVIVVSFFLGYWINKWAGGSNRGFFSTGIGLVLPWVLGLVVFLLARINMSLFMTDPTWFAPTSIAIGSIVFILLLVLITPFLLGVDFLRALVVFVLNTIVVVACVYGVLRLMELACRDEKLSKDPIVNRILAE